MSKAKNADIKAKTSNNKLKKISNSRQLLVIEKLSEVVRESAKKRKKITIGKLMKEAGYSIQYSKQPSRLAKSQNFQQLLDEFLPDDLIAEVHGDAIQASKLDHYVFPKSEDDEVIRETIESVKGCKLVKIRKAQQWKRAYFQAPDTNNRIKAIAEAYKVKNKYPAEKHQHEIAVVKVVKYA